MTPRRYRLTAAACMLALALLWSFPAGATGGYASEESLRFESQIYQTRVDYVLQRLGEMQNLLASAPDGMAWGALDDATKKRLLDIVDELKEGSLRLPDTYYLDIDLMRAGQVSAIRADITRLQERYTRTGKMIAEAFAAEKTGGISDNTVADIAAAIELKRRKALPEDNAGTMNAWLEKIKDWIIAWLQKIFPKGTGDNEGMGKLGDALTYLAITLFALLAGILLWLLYKLLRGMVRDERRKKERPATPVYPDLQKLTGSSYWKQALALMEQGAMREALRMFFHAWMHMLHDGFGSPMPWVDETNREWLKRAAPSLPPRVQADTARIARLFDRHWYGMREPKQEDVIHYRDTLKNILEQGGRRA